jgi:ABC-type Zn uptake system ZnuABC Zn-binding protein ZnuA
LRAPELTWSVLRTASLAAAVIVVLAACGTEGAPGGAGGPGSAGTGEPSPTTREAGADGPAVVSTVAPVTDLVRQVLGDRGTLAGLVPDGVDSHTFEPSPGDAQVLAAADIFIANGLFLEEPSLDLARANLPEGAPIVTLADEVIDEDDWAFDFSFPEEEGVPNPHLWLSVGYAMDYVRVIADALADLDPDGARVYAGNAESYLDQLRELDDAIAEAVATIPAENRKLVTYHDSWPYFGQRYDMAVVGAVQPSDFSEPSAAEVRTIVEQVREEAVPAVFGSEVFPSTVLRVIADEAGARYVEELSDDELPGAPGDPDHSYIGMMVANVRTMVDNLGGDASVLDAVDPSVDGTP